VGLATPDRATTRGKRFSSRTLAGKMRAVVLRRQIWYSGKAEATAFPETCHGSYACTGTATLWKVELMTSHV
jgi:hypothetical protein